MYLYQEFETEAVAACPICGSGSSQIACEAVPDILCNEARNLWQFARCNGCSSLYLKVRPRAEFISRAYASYYTHYSTGLKHRLKRSLMRSYAWLLTKPKGLMSVKRVAFTLLTYPFRTWLDSKSRHFRLIDKKIENGLDIGCGNGDFLEVMGWVGIKAYGIDFDEEAVRMASKRGFNASVGSLEDFVKYSPERFDLVAAGHVLEHVYSPMLFFKDCYEVLKPGGFLWIQTPNALAAGFDVYRKFWRGLEAPRHISLPSEKGLVELASAQGFIRVFSPFDLAAPLFTARKSESARLACSVGGNFRHLVAIGLCLINAIRLIYIGIVCRERQEFLTIVFRRPLES